jgi:hypothetical protein
VIIGPWGLRGLRDFKGLKVLRDFKDFRVFRVFKDLSGCKDNNLFLKCKMRRDNITKKREPQERDSHYIYNNVLRSYAAAANIHS